MGDGIAPGLLDAPEAVDLHEPRGPTTKTDALVLLQLGVIQPEGLGHVAEAIGGHDLEVAELLVRRDIADRGLATEEDELIEHALADPLGGLARAVGVGARHGDVMSGHHPAGEFLATSMGLPRAQGGKSRLGRVPLRLAVAHEIDVGDGALGLVLALRHDLLRAGDLCPCAGGTYVSALPQRHGGFQPRVTGAAIAEASEV